MSDLVSYDSLPFNGKRAYDVIVRGVLIDDREPTEADLGISYQVDTHSESPPKLVDLGDLRTFIGLKEIVGNKKLLPRSAVKLGHAFKWERYW